MAHRSSDSGRSWIADLRDGCRDAMDHCCRRYFDRLVVLVRRRLRDRSPRGFDEEDIAVVALMRFCEGMADGRFAALETPRDVWALLVKITRGTLADHARHQVREKRGGNCRHVAFESVDTSAGESSVLAGITTAEPVPPDKVAEWRDDWQRLLEMLPNEQHRRAVLLKAQGYTIAEIAAELQISERAVKHKLRAAREMWER